MPFPCLPFETWRSHSCIVVRDPNWKYGPKLEHLRKPWSVGAVIGMAIAVLLLAIGLSGAAQGISALKPLEYLMAIPPLLVPPVRRLSTPGLVIVYMIWWPAICAVLGIGWGRGRIGRAVVAIAVAVLVFAHVRALKAVYRDLDGMAETIGRLLTEIFSLAR